MFSGFIRAWLVAGLVSTAALEGLAPPQKITVSSPPVRSRYQHPLALQAGGNIRMMQLSLPMVSPAPDSDEVKNPYYGLRGLNDWREAALRHEPGSTDDAVLEISRWNAEELKPVFDVIRDLTSGSKKNIRRNLAKAPIRSRLHITDQELRDGDLSRLLKQGALLHTDIALLNLETHSSANTGMSMMGSIDGRMFVQPVNIHWGYARRLIDSISPAPSEDPMVRQWYIATTANMLSRRLLAYAGANIESALKLFPSDYRILFYAGALHETWASPLNQNIQLPLLAEFSFGSTETELKKARALYQKALKANPDFAEGHLRLGRVLGQLGLHWQAVVELRKAETQLEDPQLSYYASLFLGREFEMIASREMARDRYEQAARLYPDAQSPLLALSQLAHNGNDTGEAMAKVQQVFALQQGPQKEDPFWTYDLSLVRDAGTLVEDMRRMFGELQR